MKAFFERAAPFALVALGGCSAPEPTFTRDVAPVVFERCLPCHRPDGAAPFSLGSYEQVRLRARQIVDVTKRRYMPPWLPTPGYGEFEGERFLTAREIETFRGWVEAGTPEGNPADLPPLPRWPEGWELGEPDVVVETPSAFELPAEGGDVFRNFVVPVPLPEPRYVEGIELRPSERRLVHHATITLDPTRSSRRLDASDALPGFDGMRAAPGAVMPDGHFLGWTPGKSSYREPEGMSWKLEHDSDLVLQLHMPTTGKPEKVSARVGLYFTKTPARLVPVTLRLGSRDFEIPAGEKSYVVEDEYVLPVDVDAISIYPHAHYLAREMKAEAFLPDRQERWLLWIQHWDFNWQDFYRYRQPLRLPRGTRVTMRFVYDNSEANLRNPIRPPRNVRYGPSSTDEMGDLYLQVLPVLSSDLDALRADYDKKDLAARVSELTYRLAREPADADAWNGLGFAYVTEGRAEEAFAAFERSLAIAPDRADAHFNLATLLSRQGRAAESMAHFRAAIRSDPDCVDCHVRLGILLRDAGRLPEAVATLERALALDSSHSWARYNLGITLQMQGRLEEAVNEYREVARANPEDPEVRLSLGSALIAAGRCTPALRELQEAQRIAPSWSEAMSRLAYGFLRCPQAAPDALAQALALSTRAAELTRFADPHVLDTLSLALAASGRIDEAEEGWKRALDLAERSGDVRSATEIREQLSTLRR